MKKIRLQTVVLSIALTIITGCAVARSKTVRTDTVSTNGVPIHTETTYLNCYTLFDATSTIGKISNRSGYTTNGQFGPGTYVNNLNETSKSPIDTNIITAAFKGLAEGAK